MDIIYFILPVIILFSILYLCKYFNFSIIPQDLKLPPVKKYEFPTLKKNTNNKWDLNF